MSILVGMKANPVFPLCRVCGQPIRMTPYKVKAGRGRYCGQNCYMKARQATPEDFARRFWEKVRMGDGCWNWTGCLDSKGYGQLTDCRTGKKKHSLAHRVAWELMHGPIPPGLRVLHSCDNPPCVRHLFLGTQSDNIRDCVNKGRHVSGFHRKQTPISPT